MEENRERSSAEFPEETGKPEEPAVSAETEEVQEAEPESGETEEVQEPETESEKTEEVQEPETESEKTEEVQEPGTESEKTEEVQESGPEKNFTYGVKSRYVPKKDISDKKAPGKKSARRRRRKRGKKGLIALGVAAALIVGAYLAVAMFFDTHFFYHTKINGADFSFKGTGVVEDYLRQQVTGYSLTLAEMGGKKEVIKGTDIGLEYVPGDELGKLVRSQNKFLWIRSLWEPSEIQAKIGVRYDEEKLAQVLSTLGCMDESQQIASENAYPEFKNGKYEIVPEIVGTKIDPEKLKTATAEAISGFQSIINLSNKGCYLRPEFVSDSPEVVEAADKMNKYISAKITYEFGTKTEVVDAAKIVEWIKVNKKTMNVGFRKKKVKEFIAALAEKYDTKYRSKQFVTASGKTVTVEGGSFGWQIDQNDEYGHLTGDIKGAKTVSREPEYSSRGVTYGNGGVGNTYAEVDLTKQHMYFIKDGKVVLDSGVVTGNPNKGNATPQGIYTLSYKTKDAVLKGEKKPDGTYEYETPVKYWMPFNGGIGFHDATWQSSFGGDRYKSHGSHGCVNMPKDKAAKLYDLISAGTPVVCHY